MIRDQEKESDIQVTVLQPARSLDPEDMLFYTLIPRRTKSRRQENCMSKVNDTHMWL